MLRRVERAREEKRKRTRKMFAAALCLVLLCGVAAIYYHAQKPPVEEAAALEIQNAPEIVEEPPIRLTIAAVGDNLLHNTLSFDSRCEDGSYDFTPIYAPIAPTIRQADFAIVNQEVPLNGKVGAYPSLAAPQEAAQALYDAGFDAVTLANNHAGDQGVAGLQATIEALEAAGISVMAGASKTPEFPDSGVVTEVNGIRLGLLSYTYGLNTYLPTGYVNLIEQERLTKEIANLRSRCDFLMVAMHWGNEYQWAPSQSQTEQAQLLADLGVDMIIGHHPHVMQPAVWLSGANGNQTLCAYSLGNFVSNQHKRQTMLGGLLWVELLFSPEGQLLEFCAAEQQGVVTHFSSNSRNFAVYPLADYNEELAAAHGIKKHDAPLTLTYLQELYQKQKGILNSVEE